MKFRTSAANLTGRRRTAIIPGPEAAAHWLSSDYGIDSAVTKLTNEIVDRL